MSATVDKPTLTFAEKDCVPRFSGARGEILSTGNSIRLSVGGFWEISSTGHAGWVTRRKDMASRCGARGYYVIALWVAQKEAGARWE